MSSTDLMAFKYKTEETACSYHTKAWKNDRYFADDIFKRVLLTEVCIIYIPFHYNLFSGDMWR